MPSSEVVCCIVKGKKYYAKQHSTARQIESCVFPRRLIFNKFSGFRKRFFILLAMRLIDVVENFTLVQLAKKLAKRGWNVA